MTLDCRSNTVTSQCQIDPSMENNHESRHISALESRDWSLWWAATAALFNQRWLVEKKTAKNKPTQSDWKNPTDLRVWACCSSSSSLWVSSAMAWSSWCSSWDEGRGKLEYRKCGSNSWCPYCPWHFHGHLYKAMAQKNKTPIMRTSVIIIIILISKLWRRWVGDHP